MDELYLKEMSARSIVDLKLVYESTKHFHSQLLKILSILENQYVPLKNEHKIQFCLGILTKKNQKKFQEIVDSLSTINSELWKNTKLTIDSPSIFFVDIHYDFNGKDVHTQIGGATSPFTFANIFKDMVDKVKIDFDLFFANFDYLPYNSGSDLSIFWKALNTYLPSTSSFLDSIDEEDLNKRFEEALPVVEQSNAAKAKKDKEREEALENISNILDENLISFVREKAGIDYPEELIMEALETSFK